MAAAVLGGVVVLGGAYGAHVAGLLKIEAAARNDIATAVSAASTRLDGLEEKLTKVETAVRTPAPVDGVDDLNARLEALEKRPAAVENAASTEALDALKADLAGLKTAVENLPAPSEASPDPDAAARQDALTAELASLTGSLKGLQDQDAGLGDRLAVLETSSEAAITLSGDVGKVQTALADLNGTLETLEARLANAEATTKAAQTALSTSDISLKTLADSQARAAESLAALNSVLSAARAATDSAIAGLHQELAAFTARLDAVEATMGDATARELAARALSVSALKTAVDSGKPFQTELAAVKAGLPGDIDIAALEANAEAGVTPVSVLISEFPAVARAIHATFATPDPSADVFDSLLSSARSLVSVRGPGDASGTGPEADLRRMETRVADADLAGALEAFGQLPEAAQAAAGDWAGRARARVEIDKLTAAASKEVLGALGKKGS